MFHFSTYTFPYFSCLNHVNISLSPLFNSSIKTLLHFLIRHTFFYNYLKTKHKRLHYLDTQFPPLKNSVSPPLFVTNMLRSLE